MAHFTRTHHDLVWLGAPAPVITPPLVPDNGTSIGFDSVFIHGSGFTEASSVVFDDSECPSFTVNSDIEIEVLTPSHVGPGDAPGPVNVVVTTPTGVVTGVNAFTYNP